MTPAPQPARPPARLDGVIRDSLGAPIADAEVFLRNTNRGARSNAQGPFTLDDIPPETYEVWFRRLGYESAQYAWTARSGVRTEVAVTLHMLPRSPEGDACILLNGATPLRRPLSSFSTNELDLLEIYPPWTELSGTVAALQRDPRLPGRRVDVASDVLRAVDEMTFAIRYSLFAIRRRGMRQLHREMQTRRPTAGAVGIHNE